MCIDSSLYVHMMLLLSRNNILNITRVEGPLPTGPCPHGSWMSWPWITLDATTSWNSRAWHPFAWKSTNGCHPSMLYEGLMGRWFWVDRTCPTTWPCPQSCWRLHPSVQVSRCWACLASLRCVWTLFCFVFMIWYSRRSFMDIFWWMPWAVDDGANLFEHNSPRIQYTNGDDVASTTCCACASNDLRHSCLLFYEVIWFLQRLQVSRAECCSPRGAHFIKHSKVPVNGIWRSRSVVSHDIMLASAFSDWLLSWSNTTPRIHWGDVDVYQSADSDLDTSRKT